MKIAIFTITTQSRRPESSIFKMFWTTAFAGETTFGTFYEFIKCDAPVKSELSPPPGGRGLRGGGITYGNADIYHPHPNPPPSREREFQTFYEFVNIEI
jgi:hypothetical protein